MKRSVIGMVLAVLVATAGLAYGKDKPLFGDIPWGSSPTNVVAGMKKVGLFFEPQAVDDGTLLFSGTMVGENTKSVAWFTTDKKLLKIVVVLITADDDVIFAFRKMKATLVGKYGAPDFGGELFIPPYFNGDGYETQALRLGKAQFFYAWGDALSLSVTETLTVSVTYESPEWSVELRRKRTTSATAF